MLVLQQCAQAHMSRKRQAEHVGRVYTIRSEVTDVTRAELARRRSVARMHARLYKCSLATTCDGAATEARRGKAHMSRAMASNLALPAAARLPCR